MSIDSTDLLPVAARLIRSRTKDLTRGMPRSERVEFIDAESESLAYALAELAQERLEELRAELVAARSAE